MKQEIAIGNTTAYCSFPDDGGAAHPGLVLIEEIWGVDAHIKSVADRFAAEGYRVIAPELLPKGILEMLTPQFRADLFDPEKRNELQPKLRAAMEPIRQPEFAKGAVATLKACVDYLGGAVSVVGFCFGGTYAFQLAANDPRVKAAVPFYGHAPAEEELVKITCPVLAFYGDQDEPLMQSLPALKDTMAKDNKQFEAVVYPGAGHAFFNDTNPKAYRPDAAGDAWNRTLNFLKN